MTESEFIAYLATQCRWVGSPTMTTTSKAGDPVVARRVPVVEIGPAGTFTAARQFDYSVLNFGAGPAGPRTYAADVYDEDGTTLLHSAGDPVLDENGDQVVVSETDAETVLPNDRIQMPIADTIIAVTYLETQKALGTWDHYVEDKTEEKRPDLGMFFFRAWVNSGGKLVEKRYICTYDGAGNATHKELI